MFVIVLKLILGLFIWLALPEIIFSQKRFKKNTKLFIKITCKILGLLVLIYVGIDLVKTFLN